MGGLEIEWAEPADISLWMASRFINQIVECFNRTGHILNRFEQDRTGSYEPHDPVIPCLRKLVVCNHRDSLRFTFSKVYIIEPPSIAKLWHFGRPSPTFHVSFVLVAPRIPSIQSLDTGYHGFVGALAMPLNLQNIQFESVWGESRMVHTVYSDDTVM